MSVNTPQQDTQALKDQVNRLQGDTTSFVLSAGSVENALASLSDGPETEKLKFWQVEPKRLDVMPDMNPRVQTAGYKAHIRELADSMKVNGFFPDKPLAGYVAKRGSKEVIYIYEGGSRLAASLLAIEEGAPFTHVPVSIDQSKTISEIFVAMVRGNTGRPLVPFEIGVICKRLAMMGLSSKEIGTQLGHSTQYVDHLLLLMGSDHRIREMVATERVAANVAIAAILKHHEKAFDVLHAAYADALTAGKTKVTNRFVHSGMLVRAAKKTAVDLFDALKVVRDDSCFAALSEATQEHLLSLLAPLLEVEEKMEEKVHLKVASAKAKKAAAPADTRKAA